MNARLRTCLASLAAGLLVVAAGCGDDDDDADSTSPASSPAPASGPVTPDYGSDGTSGAGAGTLEAAETSLGTILTSGGKTLYIFKPDDAGDPTCYDACATAWPPLLAGASAAEGVDGALLGTSPRTDGGEQVTYNGWPLYFYAADAAPGDLNGQGVGDVWYVIDADGEPVED